MPEPPRFLQIDNVTSEGVMLNWKPPLNDGGGFITQYIVEKLEKPMTSWVRVGTTRVTYLPIEGLSSGKEYQFRVFAENLYGRSDASEASGTVKLEEAHVQKKGKNYEVGTCALNVLSF